MKRSIRVMAGLGLALSSAWVAAQSSPESLLPPGFDRNRPAQGAPATVSNPVVQPIPGQPAATRPTTLPNGARIPTLKELETMSTEQLDELLGLKPKFDMPAAARRGMHQVGILSQDEGGFPAGSLAHQNAALVKAALDGNKGRMVSRWGHILVRRALASRMDAPAGMNPADFAGSRAALLVRMGEGPAARRLVQDVDAGNYTPALSQAAVDAYLFTADVSGACPMVGVHGGVRKDPEWQMLRAICASFRGDSAGGLSQLDRMAAEKAAPPIDLFLAQRYAGASGRTRRAVKIEWDGVSQMTPWRFALASAVGLTPPDSLMRNLPARYDFASATAPMLGLEQRARAADRAAGVGILSSAAMVDLYSQIYVQEAITGDWASAAEKLRTAYIAESPGERLGAIRALWDGASDPTARYSRQVLTAYAAARMPVSDQFAKDAPDLIASMLSAGLDENALRWGPEVEIGSLAWGQLVVVASNRLAPVNGEALSNFYDADPSDGYRKSRFLLAGLLGLDRVDPNVAANFATKLEIDFNRQTKWTRLIDRAADLNNRELVVLLAGLGMQGESWSQMTSLHLYHLVGALNRVGLSAEARMIAAEAVARG